MQVLWTRLKVIHNPQLCWSFCYRWSLLLIRNVLKKHKLQGLQRTTWQLTCALNLSKIIECSLAYCHVPDLEDNSCLLLRRDHRKPPKKSPSCFPCYKGELTTIWTLGPTWFSQKKGITTHPFANIRWPAEIQPQQQTTSKPAEKPHNFIMMCEWSTCQ
jgi:hypothetical protein